MNKQIKFLILFFVKAILLYFIWFFLYENWLMKVGFVDNIIIDSLIYFTDLLLQFFGYSTFVYEHAIGIQGSHGVYIGIPCNGLDLMALFAGFILLFSGSWKTKFWFIPLGLLIIYVLNLVRVLVLTIMAKTAPEYLDFNHKYTFTILLYMFVFFGWLLWVNKYALKK